MGVPLSLKFNMRVLNVSGLLLMKLFVHMGMLAREEEGKSET